MKIVTAGRNGATVSADLFGGNTLFHIDNDVPVLKQKLGDLGVTNLRWPGGSITEGWFDPANPDVPLLVARPHERPIDHDNILSFTEVMTLAWSTGRAVDLVLPTQHILKPADAQGNRVIDKAAVAEITEFVRQALLPGGAYPDAKIASFEIGNEYWSSMSAKEYGQIANVLVKAVQKGIDAAGVQQHPKVLVQVGDAMGPEFRPGGEYHGQGLGWGGELQRANQDLIDQLDSGARSMIDGLIEHFYPRNRGEMSFNTVEAWSTQKKQSVWAENGMKLGLHVTEWNLNSKGLQEGQDVFSSGSGMLETFEYMVRIGVQSAHVWPITQGTLTDLTGKAEGGAGNLSSNGAVLTLLSQNVRGLSWQKLNIEDNPVIESSFFTGSNKSVLFLTADDGIALNATLDLSGLAPAGTFQNGYLRVTRSQIVRDASHDLWVGKGAGAQIVQGPESGGTSVTVSLKPYEIIMMKLEWMPPKLIMAPGASSMGSAVPEIFHGGALAQIMRALGGNDVVHGAGGNDSLLGGNGADTLFGGAQDDILWGEAGNDVLNGEAGADRLHGGLGNDALHGGDGNDQLKGEEGDDRLFGGNGNDMAAGGAGADTLFGGPQDDILWGEAGDDVIIGQVGADRLHGGLDDDALHGNEGSDTLIGDAGSDVLHGNAGDDLIDGGLGSDTFYGGWGNDAIFAGAGSDLVIGGGGDDRLSGGLDNDLLYGGEGNDSLGGHDGSDVLRGGRGNDVIDGGAGNDTLVSGDGDDMIKGGAGDDRFYFGTTSTAEGGRGVDYAWGGAGADQFMFAGRSGTVSIMDLQDGIDLISFHGSEVETLEDLTIRASGRDSVMISFSGGQIWLNHISPTQLSESDFMF